MSIANDNNNSSVSIANNQNQVNLFLLLLFIKMNQAFIAANPANPSTALSLSNPVNPYNAGSPSNNNTVEWLIDKYVMMGAGSSSSSFSLWIPH